MSSPEIWGDEDGEAWYSTGHHSVETMIEAIFEWEDRIGSTVAGEIAMSRNTHSHYYVIDDPKDEERYVIVDAKHPGAQPMTMIGA